MKLPADPFPDKILVVDDTKELAELVSLYLRQKGYEVHTAFSGEDAINLLEEHAQYLDNMFDLVITDQEMPGMLGSELIGNIREKKDYKALKILMITFLPQDDLKNVGFDAFLSKPLDFLLLVDMVRDLLSH